MERTLLVIGASSDIGMAVVDNIMDEYDHIILHYFHMSEALSKLGEKAGSKAVCIQADLSIENEVFALVEQVKNLGIIPSHILHFPAPICNNSKFHKIGWEVFQNEIDISLKSLILILQSFLPEMSKIYYGRIIIMLSFVVNNMPPAYCCNYVTSKYALLGLMKALATEYAGKGITVNGISPAWVMTKYIDNQPDMLIQQNASTSPIGRNLEVKDIIPSIKFLLSDGAECINGQNIIITGGR